MLLTAKTHTAIDKASLNSLKKQLVITVSELLSLRREFGDDLLIVDARPKKEFLRGHIPGAINIGWEAWNDPPPPKVRPILKEPGYWGKLACPQANNFSERFREYGLDKDIPVVVYANGNASKGREGRIAWMLLYFGAENVAMLNGGIKAWRSKRLPLDTQITTRKRSSFQVNTKEERRLLHTQLVSTLGTDSFPKMIDTRSVNEYTGKIFWYQPKKGRIPDAHLVVYNDIYTEDNGLFIEQEAYKSLLPDNFESYSNLGTYCEVGVRTCAVSLLHEHYTGQILPVYDGSIMEWSFDDELPVLTL